MYKHCSFLSSFLHFPIEISKHFSNSHRVKSCLYQCQWEIRHWLLWDRYFILFGKGSLPECVLQNLVQEELVLSCQQHNSSPYLISIITRRQQEGFFFPLLILAMIDAVEAEHYLCKMTSEVTAEFDALTFPKQAVYTGSAVYPEFDNISLKLLVLWFCGYKFQFSSLFPVKTFSSDKQIDHQKEQF